jgi:hypothetical protein
LSLFVGLRAQGVVEVGDVQRKVVARGQAGQEVQQAKAVGAAGDADYDGVAGAEEAAITAVVPNALLEGHFLGSWRGL